MNNGCAPANGCAGGGEKTGVLCAGLGFAGLKGLGGRASADAQVRPAVEGDDGARDEREEDGAEDQRTGGTQACQICATGSHNTVIGHKAQRLSRAPADRGTSQ
jgi:hypothetical protein